MRMLFCAELLAAPAVRAETGDAASITMPVLARQIERGEILAPADFEMKPALPHAARGILKPEDAIGKEAARRLMASAAVRATDLVRSQIVRRGDLVTVTIRTGALSITTTGRALSGGGVGDMVRVANPETGRPLSAVVEEKGRVRVAASWEDR